MSDTDVSSEPERLGVTDPHDHAWRRVRREQQAEGILVGEYRCDLCSATWAM